MCVIDISGAFTPRVKLDLVKTCAVLGCTMHSTVILYTVDLKSQQVS